MNKEQFDSNAKQFGNKVANLMRLKDLNSEGESQFVVPEFIAFSHEIILGVVIQTIPDFKKTWGDFYTYFQENGLENNNSKTMLDDIQKAIINAFDGKNIFSGEFRLAYPSGLANKNLMVRSTGNEDSDELSNAGGNLSLQSLSDEVSLSKSIGRVVASYFSLKSLEQRLKAGDTITAEPFIPVLLQELIGENINGNQNPVSSGVAFVVNGKVTINAAFGHNELVVESKSTTDSFYVTPTNHVIYNTTRKKPIKIKPQIEGNELKLSIAENSLHAIHTSSLSQEQVHKVASYARFVEKEYGKPMDIEFVVSGDKVYVVQARPFIQNIDIESPSALNPELLSELDIQFKGQNITPKLTTAKKINSSNEIYLADDIKAAHEYFRSHDGLKAVIIKKNAASNSHYALEFKNAGVIVLQINDIEAISDLIKVIETQPLIIDPQRGSVFQLKTGDTRSDDEIIHKGLFSSALEGSTNVSGIEFFNQSINPEEIKEVPLNSDIMLGGLIASAKSSDIELAKNAMSQLFSLIFSKIKDLPAISKDINIWEVIKNNLEDLHKLNSSNHEETSSKISQIMQAVYLLRKKSTAEDIISPNLFKQLMLSGSELLLIIDKIKEESSDYDFSQSKFYAEYLDIIKKFSGLILGDNIDVDAIGDSLIQNITNAKNDKKLKDEIKELDLDSEQIDILKAALQLEKYFINNETKKLWHQFAIDACKSKDDAHKLAEVITLLVKLNLIDKGCNILIASFLKEGPNITDILANISKELLLANENLAPIIAQTQAGLLELESRVGDWEHPKYFDELFDLLNEVFEKLFSNKEQLNSQGIISQIYNSNSLLQFIEILDLSTKSLISSSNYNAQDNMQTINFSKMLKTFYKIFQNLYVQDSFSNALQEISTIVGRKLSDIKKFDESDLKLSPDYTNNVVFDPATSTSTALDFDVEKCKSLHDFLTFIHQACISFAAKRASVVNTRMFQELPDILKSHCATIVESITSFKSEKSFNNASTLSNGFVPKLSQVDISSSKILIAYSIPLRQHGAGIQLEYDTCKDSTLVTFKAYGGNEMCRWNYCSFLTKLNIGFFQGVKFTSDPEFDFKKDSYSFQLSLDSLQKNQITKIFTAITIDVLLFSTATYASDEITEVNTFFNEHIMPKLSEINKRDYEEFENAIFSLNKIINSEKETAIKMLDFVTKQHHSSDNEEDEEDELPTIENLPLVINCNEIYSLLLGFCKANMKSDDYMRFLAVVTPLPEDEDGFFETENIETENMGSNAEFTDNVH